jgi:isopentenyldiphosphate isomerase
MSEEFVILVDGNDNPIGSEEKVKCHLPNGKLHRAFTALLFDEDGRLVLTRRAKGKMLWPMIGMEHLQVIQENQKLMFHQGKEECLKN